MMMLSPSIPRLRLIRVLLVTAVFAAAVSPGCFRSGDQKKKPEEVIRIWYGSRQSFGEKGNPQRWINIPGTVRSPGGVSRAYYTLNGGEKHVFSLGQNMDRLARDGDFNIDMDRHSLKEGMNNLAITLVDGDGVVFEKKVRIKYYSGRKWPVPYSVSWDKVKHIGEAVQVVDGNWMLTPEGIRTVEPYYDRMVALGDSTWTNYSVTVDVKFHGYPSPVPEPPVYGVCHAAIALRWPGHDEDHRQPRVKWYPLGATCEFKLFDNPDTCRFRIIGDHDKYNEDARTRHRIVPETWYTMKAMVVTGGDSTFYCAKLWNRSDPEPTGWDITSGEGDDDLKGGSALLIAHHADVTFGNIKVMPVCSQDEKEFKSRITR